MALLGHAQQQCAEALREPDHPRVNQTTVSRWLRAGGPTDARKVVDEYCRRAEAHAVEMGMEIRPLTEYGSDAERLGAPSGREEPPDITSAGPRETGGPDDERLHEGLRIVPKYVDQADELGSGAAKEELSSGEGLRRFRDIIVEPRMAGGFPLSDAEIAYFRDVARVVYGVNLDGVLSSDFRA